MTFTDLMAIVALAVGVGGSIFRFFILRRKRVFHHAPDTSEES